VAKSPRKRTARPQPRAGGIAPMLPSAAAGGLPVGGGTTTRLMNLGADASGQFDEVAPTFGNILASVGVGVATSQEALDRGVIDTVRALSDTKITVVTEVIEELNDDGLPDVDKTRLVTSELSVLNFVPPTVHEWRHVALSMDMTVGAMDNETGMQFSVASSQTSAANVGLFFGALGVGYLASTDTYRGMNSDSKREAQWSQGSVQLDATLAPRRSSRFPVPATVSIGPQIFVSQGSVVETRESGVLTDRQVDVLITVRKASGAPNPDKELELDAAGLLPSFNSTAPFAGSKSNADGQCKVNIKRLISQGFSQPVKRTLTLRLGDISKRFDIVI
jgi:hypothetical protein